MTLKIDMNAAFPQWHWLDEKHEVVIFKKDGQLQAAASLCPHMGARLQPDSKGCLLKCPWHGLEFRLHGPSVESSHPTYRHLVQYDVQESQGLLTLTVRKGK